MANYILSPEAARSISEIDAYTEKQFGSLQANRYLESLLDQLNYIAEDPLRVARRYELNISSRALFTTVYEKTISKSSTSYTIRWSLRVTLFK